MNFNDCTSQAILQEITGYPSCIINLYSAQHAVTIRWSRQHRSKTLYIPADITLEDWVKKYANDNETTPEFFAIDRPQTSTHYRIYDRREDGTIEWSHWIAPQDYSKYYENDLRYNLDDARNHRREVFFRTPAEKARRMAIIEVTTTLKVVD